MFYIDTDKTISYETHSPGADQFNSQNELLAMADAQGWTRDDLESMWNGFAGVVPFDNLKPVVKFRNRPYGVQKIWHAIQRLTGSKETAEQIKQPRRKRAAAPASAKSKTRRASRNTAKRDEVVRLMKRERGVSLDELMENTGWQRHSVRGFVSTLGSKHGVKVISERHQTKGRVYRVE